MLCVARCLYVRCRLVIIDFCVLVGGCSVFFLFVVVVVVAC